LCLFSHFFTLLHKLAFVKHTVLETNILRPTIISILAASSLGAGDETWGRCETVLRGGGHTSFSYFIVFFFYLLPFTFFLNSQTSGVLKKCRWDKRLTAQSRNSYWCSSGNGNGKKRGARGNTLLLGFFSSSFGAGVGRGLVRLSALSRFLASGSVGGWVVFRTVVVVILVGHGGGKLGGRMERMMMMLERAGRFAAVGNDGMGWDGMDIFGGGTWKRGGRLFCFILCAGPFFY
jgi:hypothetical protein